MWPVEVSSPMRAFLGLALGGAESCPRSGVGDLFLLATGIERSKDMLVFFSRLRTDGRESSKKLSIWSSVTGPDLGPRSPSVMAEDDD